MRITIFLFIVGFCLVSAKYLSYEIKDSNALRRIKRSDDSDDSSSSVEQKKGSSENDEDDDDDYEKEVKLQELEDKIKRKALERQEKEKRKKEEEQRKLEEKRAKAQRKEEEKREKEERKRIEKLEKEKRKEEERLEKEERKKQEKQRKELEKLEKEATQNKILDSDSVETEEENSVELSDIWKEHIYVKYGLSVSSPKLEKQAALNKYLQEELGLNQNSTEKERFQAVVQLIQTKLQTDTVARTAFRNQLSSHINAVSIQKWRSDIEKDMEELNNKTEILNNVTLLWVPTAKQQIEEKRSFLETISQFLSNILPSWIAGGQNAHNSTSDSTLAVNPSVVGVSNGPNVISENNVNSASGSNVASGNSDIPVTPSQSNDVAGTGNDVSSSSVDQNSPVQKPSQIPPEGSGDMDENNINQNTKPLSTNVDSSGNSNDVTEVNKDTSFTGEVASVDSEIPSEGNSSASENGDNVSLVDNNVVPLDNISNIPAGSTNTETISVPLTVGSGDSNDATGVNENTSSAGEVTTINIEIPSEGISAASENGDNNLSVDSSVVPSENTNEVPASSANTETISVSNTVGSEDSIGATGVNEGILSTGEVTSVDSEIPTEGNSAASGNGDNALSVDSSVVPSENTNVPAGSVNTENISAPNSLGSGDSNGATGVNEGTLSTGEVTSVDSEIPSEGNSAASGNGDNAFSLDSSVVPSENTDVPAGSVNIETISAPNSLGSGDSNGATGVDEGTLSTGEVTSVDKEIPSEGNSAASENGDNALSVDSSVVPSENTNDVLAGSANDEITSVPNSALNPSLSSTNINADGVTSVSMTSTNDVPLISADVTSSGNDKTTNAGDNTSINPNSNNADSSLAGVENSVLANPSEIQSSGASEAASGNSGIAESSSSTDNVASNNGVSIANVTDDSLPVIINVVSSGINDAGSASDVEDQTSHVTGNLAPSSISTSQGNDAVAGNTANVVSPVKIESDADTIISEVPTGGSETPSADDVSILSSSNTNAAASITPDVVSSSNSDNKTTTVIIDENVTSDVTENVIVPAPTVIVPEGNEASPDSNANINSNSIIDGGLSENPGAATSEGSEGISIDSSNLASTTITVNASTVNPDIVSTGNSDTTVENVGSPSSNVAGDIKPPSSGVVYAEDTEIAPDNTVKPVLITDNVSDASLSMVSSGGSEASSSNLDVEVPSVSVDVVSSSATSAASPDLISSTSNYTVSANNNDIVSSSVVDNISPANIDEVIPEVVESANSGNDVSSNGINNVDVTPVNNDIIPADITPSESSNPVTSIINDPAVGVGSIDIIKIPEVAPVDLPNTASDLSATSIDTTIAPEIINSVQTQENIDNSAQVVSIVTNNPVEPNNGNEAVIVISDIINNVNTVSTAAAETTTPSEAPQVETTPSSVVDTVAPVELPAPVEIAAPVELPTPVELPAPVELPTPVELPAPVVIINGITIPDEPGASVVEILPQ